MMASRDDSPWARASLPPIYCTVGPTLARLEVWTEAEWQDRDESASPTEAVHVPGLGWVVALPVLSLN